ncbi:MAG: glycosyltransferase [Flavobacteriales bacterium]|nr:glycosyltransferase [Flavobacteriales bacterium]MBL4735249.1 glycosyltransferase [Flavobacteriales bacterium]
MTRVIASVTNDLSIDQRLHKVCSTLSDAGYEVLLVGRKFKDSPAIRRPYQTKRMRLLFNRGALFYAAYNFRLFFFLLFKRCDILVANDLDTLLANYCAAKIKGVPLIYDSHEYFCGMPELSDRPFVRSVWRGIERSIFPKLKCVITVNQSVADLYHNEYGKEVHVVKNYPMGEVQQEIKSKSALGLPDDKHLILYQGAVNLNRGLEEAVQAMQWVDNAILLIIGNGNSFSNLKKVISSCDHRDRIMLKGWLPFEELIHYTKNADVGLAIEKDSSLNYKYSLSNKLFDYIHSGLPILSSRLVENERIISEYEVGAFIDNHDPQHIASQLGFMLSDSAHRDIWTTNLKEAKAAYKWENQVPDLMRLYHQVSS